ncbi:MAG: xanthine dehydrogenase family protein subunit M [Deltaproteobacteria bacterium]|nr:xanthine dehydrogenase family protein subunit M [Deltaproteobacteria bacterium]
MIRDFQYLRPDTPDEAFALLAEHEGECKVICGGQSLLIVMRQGLIATDYLLDIKHLRQLASIGFDWNDGLRIGATTTHRAIENSDFVRANYPVLERMEKRLASIQVRNWGTIGGNLAHADPAGDPGPVLVALHAEITVGGSRGERTMPLEDFFVDYFETALDPTELVLGVRVPPPQERTGAAYEKFNLLQSDMGVVGVAASVTLGADGACKAARVVLGGAGPKPLRAPRAEALLVGARRDEGLFAEAGRAASEECEPVADIHASEAHRRHLIGVLTKRMLAKAWEEAAG